MMIVESQMTKQENDAKEQGIHNNLTDYKSKDYDTVVFVLGPREGECKHNICESLNGSIYKIDDLIPLQYPLGQITHPYCRCSYEPYKKTEKNIQTPLNNINEPVLPTNVPNVEPVKTINSPTTPTPGPNGGQQLPKSPWYKRWMPWLFKNKSSINFRERILKRAQYAKNVRTSKELLRNRKNKYK